MKTKKYIKARIFNILYRGCSYGKNKTRKDKRYISNNFWLMPSCKARTFFRKIENRKYRRDKFNIAPHKKVGIAYIWNIF